MFNLRRHAFTDDGSRLSNDVKQVVDNGLSDAREQLRTNRPTVSDETSQQQMEGMTPEQQNLVTQQNEQSLVAAITPIFIQHQQQMAAAGISPDGLWNEIKKLPSYQRAMATPPSDLARQIQSAFQDGGGAPKTRTTDYEALINNVKTTLQTQLSVEKNINRNKQPGAVPPAGVRAFNIQQYRTAQAVAEVQSDRFPVESVGDFIDKFLRDLMAWNGNHKERDALSARALEEIRSAVGQGFEEEANSALKTIQRMDADKVEKAAQILAQIYQEWLSPMVKIESEKQAMSDTVSGIVKFNLSDHVLNNKQAEATGLIKTAANHFGSEYFLYGPTEKRICPKLRGRNSNGGDVVSEYICRHHCLDGVVIDDNKTICGEALWRANVMDKFSREYVNAEGEIVGGYINKRFEINRNVPEENKMRLKPGETRKPRPAEIFGNLEARMQAMRNKEGEDRGYRPETDTSKPFNWVKDVDQNNVEVAQKERDRREEESGHKTVQYTNKDQQENNPKLPKKSFNLKNHKTAELETEAYRLDDAVNDVLQAARHGFDVNSPPPELQQRFSSEVLDTVVSKLVQEGKAVRMHGKITLPQNQTINWPPVAADTKFNLNQYKQANSKKKS